MKCIYSIEKSVRNKSAEKITKQMGLFKHANESFVVAVSVHTARQYEHENLYINKTAHTAKRRRRRTGRQSDDSNKMMNVRREN